MRQFCIIKVFNNNVVLARDKTDREEAVLVGKGLGFNAKPGNMLEDDKAEKIFYFIDKDKVKQLNRFNEDIIGITEEIISMVSQELKEQLNEHIHVALADHIGFTLERLETGLEITNPFLEEIKGLYPKEYELACKSAAMIEEKFAVDIPDGEKGFIAMHIHSARIDRELAKTVKSTSMINKMVEIIEQELRLKLDRQDTNYARLIIHLRFALDRIDSEMTIKNPLLARIKEEFSESYKIAIKIAEYIKERIGKEPPEDELGYLALHIQRIKDSLAEHHIK
ncbi:Transcriptional antiterminator, BglG [Tepidanaerobacter acetatoxydans Re1]|uniref:Transcriptional antiterminator, BglG n=1 Tax=Tepidanaerobacter acetatoxydans (strain DSM 21804 / JCM 16047 / Re1) TaxID=1209989 RepID=F4LX72_TEPAE|nr:PRD domain-containing protein [Tepidanaerobacter acetatoxydans]AEE91871.1 transcriptional antiterminator, BglG [Tepidanaerobacter acetatoxydans Re1]CCP26681.1 Transcriptional antiterminator, BglG [Tepidanaerobacter acetatoxydans Re1]